MTQRPGQGARYGAPEAKTLDAPELLPLPTASAQSTGRTRRRRRTTVAALRDALSPDDLDDADTPRKRRATRSSKKT